LLKPRFNTFINRSLNYGRAQIDYFCYSKKSKSKRILDIGAGHGDDLLIAKKHNPRAELHAIEVYKPYVVELVKKGIEVHSVNLEVDNLPFETESVDIVIANQILEHVKEIFWLFHEVSRVLKTGGNLIIGVPNLASLHNRLSLLFGEQPSCIQNNSAHIRGYTKKDILKLLNSCYPGGYNLKQFKGSNFYPFPSFLAKPLASAFPNFAWGIFLLLEKQKSYSKEFLEFPVENQLETNFYLGNKF